MHLFTPKRADGKAEWRVAYEFFDRADYGEVVTLDDLCAALEVPRTGNLHRVYGAVGRAARELRKHNHKSIESVPGEGYRVLMPQEHILQERSFRQKGYRRLETGLAVIRATPLDMLEEAERQQAIAQGNLTQALCMAVRELDRRSTRTEKLLEQVSEETTDRLDAHEREIERIRRLLGMGGDQSEGTPP